MEDNYFSQFDGQEDAVPMDGEVHQQGPQNFFSVYDAEPDAAETIVPKQPVAVESEVSVEPVPGVSVNWFADDAYERMNRQAEKDAKARQDTLNEERGNGFLEGLIDPQQYGEFAKGIVPGGVRFAGTTMKGVAGIQEASVLAGQTDLQRQVALFDRIDRGEDVGADGNGFEIEIAAYQQMSPEQRQAYRQKLTEDASAPRTALEDRTLFQAGEATKKFAKGLLPAAEGYDQATGRQLGEGIGSLLAGLPAGFLGRVPAAIFFGAGGSGEALERALDFDKKEKAAGKAGLTDEQKATATLYGIGPGVTDLAPIELLLGRLKVPKPFQKVFANAIGRIGGQAFVEGLQEGGQSFLQNLIAQEVYNPDQSLTQGVLPEAGMGAGVGAIAATAKTLVTSFAGRRGGSTSQPLPEDATLEEIADALDNPQAVNREDKADPLELNRQPVKTTAAKDREPARVEAEQPAQQFERRGDRPQETQGKSVTQFIRERGGIQPSGEVAALDAQRYPGLVSSQGMTPDEAREALVDAGYLAESGPDQEAATTPEDVYDLLDREMRGERIVPLAEQQAERDRVTAEQSYQNERELQSAEQNFILPELQAMDDEAGSPTFSEAYAKLSNDDKAELIERSSREGEDVADLLEELAIRNQDVPTIAAMAVRRVGGDEQVSQIRSALEQQSPELVQAFDELVSSQAASQEVPASVSEPVKPEARQAFTNVLNARVPRSQWASRAGLSEEELQPVVEEAIEKGFLRRDKNGVIRRVPKSQRTGSFAAMALPNDLPDTMLGDGDVSLTPEAADQKQEMNLAVQRAAMKILPDAVRVDVVDNIEIAQLRKEDERLALRERAAFWSWFGDSKVVDENGEPLRVYHGTNKDFERFDTSRSNEDGVVGAFFSDDPDFAAEYGDRLLPVYLSLQNPYIIDNLDWGFGEGLSPAEAKDAGYDGYIIKGMEATDAFIAFDPAQIKSAIGNRGTFDPNDPRITYALRKGTGLTESPESATVEAENEGVTSEQPAQDGTASGREGGEVATAQPAPGGAAGEGQGVPPSGNRDLGGLARTPDARIIRQESASLRADGSIITGRPSREGSASEAGRETAPAQRVGVAEEFSIEGFDGSVTAEKLVEADLDDGNLARLTYRIYKPGTEQLSPAELGALEKKRSKLKNRLKKTRFGSVEQSDIINQLAELDERIDEVAPKAEMYVVQRSDGAWEIDFVGSREPGRGVGTKLYNAVEADLGVRMSPSGVLTDQGLAFWQKRSPASVQWHVPTPTWKGFNFSPRRIDDEIKRLGREIQRVSLGMGTARHLPLDMREENTEKLKKERRQLSRLYATLPLEARAAKDSMFALRGFFSPAIRAAENLSQKKGTGEQFWKQIAKIPGVRKDELEWMGLEEFLADKKSITRDEVLEFMRAHQVELDEQVLGDTLTVQKDLTDISAEEVVSRTKWSEDWFEQAEAIWSYRLGDEQYYITKNSDPEDGPYSLFYGDGNQMTGEPASLDQARHMLDGVYGEEQDDPGITKFADYKVLGGENYRELLIRLPELSERSLTPEERSELADIDQRLSDIDEISYIQRAGEVETDEDRVISQLHKRRQALISKGSKPRFESPHFQDQEIVHLRVDDRTGPNGEKVLFINEIQSDLHQSGRKRGYLTDGTPPVEDLEQAYRDAQAALDAFVDSNGIASLSTQEGQRLQQATDAAAVAYQNSPKVPNAPFKGDLWLELALKRALLYASENGYDAVSWARSDQIAKAVGGDAEALSVQYDQKIGRFLSKYTKKWGGKVEKISGLTETWNSQKIFDLAASIDDPLIKNELNEAGLKLEEGEDFENVLRNISSGSRERLNKFLADTKPTLNSNPILDITPEMRASVMEGQPLAMSGRRPASQPQALGRTDPHNMTISIAMKAVEAEAASKGVSAEQEAVRVLRHEAIEFFNSVGMFTPKEWKLLRDTARKQGWVESTGVRQAYEAVYKEGMSEADLNDLLVKEAIAEQYSEFHLGRKQFKGKIAEVFQRIKDFIDRVANYMRGEGFQTWDDVFERIDRGEFKQRFEDAFPELASQREVATGARAMQATAGKIADSPARQASAGTQQPSQGLAEIIGNFNRALGLTVRQGRLDPGLTRSASMAGNQVRGQTSMATGVVRLRVPNEIDTLAHEGGHALENRFQGDLEAVKQQHAAELTPLASPGPDAVSEGFAEWFRRYVTNPSAAQRVAPNFTTAFEQFLGANDQAMLTNLQGIQSGYQEWINAPSGGAVASSITTTVPPGSTKEVVREFKQEGLRNTMQAWTDRIYTAVFDDLHPVRMTVDGLLDIASKNLKISKNKLGLKTVNNPYKLLRLARDGYSAGHMDLLYGVHGYKSTSPQGPALRDAVATAFGGFDQAQWSDEATQEFGAYLSSRRMVQEWARFKAGEITAPPDKFSLADHQQAIKDFEAKYPGFAQGAQQVYAFLNNMLAKKRDAGLITAELYDQLIQKQDYVPVMRDMSDRGGSVEGASSARKDKFSVINRFRGSQRDVINPLESIAKDAYETAMIIARNDAVKALDALARAAGPDGGKFAERVPAHEMKATQVNVQEALRVAAKDAGVNPADMQIMMQAVDDQLGDNAIAQVWRAGDVSEKGEAIIYLWEDGKRIPIRLADGKFGHDMLHAVSGLNREAADWWVNVLSIPSTILRTGVTASADFIGANYIRDQVSAWVLTRDFVPFLDGAKGIYSDLALKDVSRIYSRVGGIMGGANAAAQHESRIKREVKQLRRKGIRFTLNPFTRDFWRMTEFSETGTRLAVFQRAFDRAKNDGLSDWESSVEAAFIARDYIDFGRRGSRMLAARRLVPFFNAALQGLDRGIRGMRGRVDAQRVLRDAISPYIKSRTGQPLSRIEQENLKQSSQVWAYAASLGLIGLGLSLLYKDDEEYEEISDYIKATHWIFRIGGQWVRIPKPFELAFVSNFIERTFDYVYKDDPTAVKNFIDGLYEITVPPHSIPGLAVTTELATDYSFFSGRPIVGPFLKSLPPELQFNAYASEFGKYLGKQVGVSPAYIDHFITGFGASWGREFVNASDRVLPAIGQATDGVLGLPTQPAADPAVQDYFFVRRFTTDPKRGSTSVRKFWDLMAMENGKFIQAANGYKHLVDKVRDVKGAQELLDRLPKEQKAYALLNAGNSEGRSKYRRLHPLNRAKEIVSVAGGMKKEINLNRLYKGKDGDPIELSPAQMRTVTDLLSDITMRETRNALIALKERGWAQKKVLDVDPVYDELKAAAPDVHKELTDRLKSKKLPSYETVVKGWPIARDRILEDGQKAIVSDLYRRDYSIGQGSEAYAQ